MFSLSAAGISIPSVKLAMMTRLRMVEQRWEEEVILIYDLFIPSVRH